MGCAGQARESEATFFLETKMTIKLGINGFGRIGHLTYARLYGKIRHRSGGDQRPSRRRLHGLHAEVRFQPRPICNGDVAATEANMIVNGKKDRCHG